MIGLALVFGGVTTAFAVTGDNIAALITAGLTTLNTALLIWGQRHLRRTVEPKLDDIHDTAAHVQGVVDRRKLDRPTQGQGGPRGIDE